MSEELRHLPHILTHRALEPGNPNYLWGESTLEGFTDQVERGFGLEFDLVETTDNALVVLHDSNLKRLTAGRDERPIAALKLQELRTLKLEGQGSIALFSDLLELIANSAAPFHALHLKARLHNQASLERIAAVLTDYPSAHRKIICFDTLKTPTVFLKSKFPEMKFAPSVAHPWDIHRYGAVTGNTLITLEELIDGRELFEWAWLDEWDLADADGGTKRLYCADVFERLRQAGISIALVTPELHGTSPGLLGGEAHPDARTPDTLAARWREILAIKPDAICTDFPEILRSLSFGV